MGRAKPGSADKPAELAARLSEALQRERIVPRFADFYVVQHSRQAVQAHAERYRDLLALLQREALIAASVHAIDILVNGLAPAENSRPRPMPRKDAAAFRRQFFAELARQQKWTAGDALDFQKDFRVYEHVIANTDSARRRKSFEAANHPFVDRCAFLLDPSFLEAARLAASRALAEVETLAVQVVEGLR